MRRVSLLLVVLFLALAWGCTSTPSTPSGAGGGSGNGGGTCTAETQCQDTDVQAGCITCAESGPCLEELNRCNMSEDCLSYGQCIQACVQGDDECVTTCADGHPEGSSAYARLLQCVICEQCSVPCDGPGSGCTP